nr:proteasome maturation protein [Cryptococcus depauperatus CBS 7855]
MASLKIVPSATAQSHAVSTHSTAHPVSGLHDTFRYGPQSAAQSVAAGVHSPLEMRLKRWNQTRAELQQSLQRNTFGLAVPMKQAMEIKLVQKSPHNPLLDPTPLGGSPNLALEILQGKDETLEVDEFMGGGQDLASVLDVNAVMEKKRGI